MNKYIKTLFAAFFSLALTSCAKEIEQTQQAAGTDALVFKASMNATKTTYDGDRTTLWAAGNVVKVFDAAGASDSYTIEKQCGDFEFSSTKLGSGPYFALAGKSAVIEAATFDAATSTLSFPMGSTFDGSFDAADVLACKSATTSLFFTHCMGIFEFSTAAVSKVEFAASGAFAQSINLTFDAEGKTVATPVNPSDETSFDLQQNGTYYFPVVPQTYAEGFTFKATKSDGTVKEHKYAKSITVNAGSVKVAGLLGSPYEVDENGRATVQISDEGRLEVYYANKKNSKCVILYPGGAYSVHSAGGIGAVIDAFKNVDVTLIVDYFTLPSQGTKRDQALADANTAIDLAWENKDIWGGYTKVGVIGNSAGGHLAGYMAQSRYKDVDFQILIYPVVTLEDGKTHDETRFNWLGGSASQDLTDKFCNEKHVSLNTPPTYLSWSTNDPTVPQATNGKVMGEALRAVGHKNFEEHVYNDNQHSVNGWPDWPYALYIWLDSLDGKNKPNPDAESWSDITTSYAAANNINFGTNIKMYKTENLNGFEGNVAYRFEIPAGKVGMKVAAKYDCGLNSSADRKISGTVRKFRDYTIFISYQGPGDIFYYNGTSATMKYLSPLLYGPDANGVTKVLRANDGWENKVKAYAPAIAFKDGKVQMKPAITKDGKIYCYSDVKGSDEQLWDVESAFGGIYHLVHDGEVLISEDTDQALETYVSTWLATPDLKTRLVYDGQKFVPFKTYARYRHPRTIIGCTADGGLVIVSVEKIVDWDNRGRLEDDGHNGICGDTRGVTMYESAQLMKRLGCSDAMTVEDICWAPVILQDGGEHGNDLFKTYRRYDLRGNGQYRDIEFENLGTLCIK